MKNLLKISYNAGRQLKKIIEESNSKNIFFYVKGGGCNGFNYKFKPINEIISKLDEKHKMDIDEFKFNIFICNKSLIHLIGTEIDWKKNIMGESFEFKNPNAQSNCGCGSSFSSKSIT